MNAYKLLAFYHAFLPNTVTSGSFHASENQHSHVADHQHRSGSNPSSIDHRTASSEHRTSSEHRSHHSEGRSHSREPLKEARSRPPSQQSSKASPANSTHSSYSPIRKDKADKEGSPLPDEDLIRSRHESSKKWSHSDDPASYSKHKRPHSKKRPGLESPLPSSYSKKHHRDERSASGHRGGGGGSSRGGTPERKEKRGHQYHRLPPSSESLLHD